MLRFRFRELLAEKERREEQRISLADVSAATRIGTKVLSNISSPNRAVVTNTAFVEALCRYFGCPIESLVVFTPEIGAEETCDVDELYPNRRNRGGR